ncbi:MAG: VanZ family protein [Cellulosilyticaceae bacterium]
MKPFRLVLHFLPAFLVMCIIFSLSLQPGDVSTETTGTLSQSIADKLGLGNGDSDTTIDDPNASGIGGTTIWAINLLLRSLSRIIAFGGLGLMIILGCLLSKFQMRTHIYLTLGAGIIISFIDEVIKLFIPGRHFSLFDIGKNTIGLALALIGSYILYWLYIRITKKHTSNHPHIPQSHDV